MNRPEYYTLANNLQREDGKDISEEYSEQLSKMSGRCIDVGSGPGDVVAEFILPKLSPEASIVCSDISEPMVNFGKDRYKDNDRLSFRQLDIQTPNLPEDLAIFDTEKFFSLRKDKVTVTCWNHALTENTHNFVPAFSQALKNIFDLLKPGGTTLLAFLANNPIFDGYEVLAEMPRYQPYMKDVESYIPVFQHTERPREALIALLKDVGFEVHHCSCRTRAYTFKTQDHVRDFLLAVNPFIERMPTDLKEEYKKDLLQQARKKYIVFNQNRDNDDDYSTLAIYYLFLVYLKKPLYN